MKKYAGCLGGNEEYALLQRKTAFVIASFLFFASIAYNPFLRSGSHQFDWLRLSGRPTSYLIIIICLIVLFFSSRRPFVSVRMPIAIAGYLGFLLIFAIKSAFSNLPLNFALYSGVFFTYFAVFGFLLISPYQRIILNIETALVGIGAANILMLIANILVIQLEGTSGFLNARVAGLTFNPNTLAYNLAISSMPLCAVVSNIKLSKLLRAVFLYAILLGNVTLIIASGSRGAFIVVILSVLINTKVLFQRFGTIPVIWILTMGATIAFFLDYKWYGVGVFEGRKNTRDVAWGNQISGFTEHPFFGVPWDDSRIKFGESTFLGVASQLGLVGLVAVLLIFSGLILQIVELNRLSHNKFRIVQSRDLLMAVWVAILVASVLEAVLLGVIGLPIYVVLLLSVAIHNQTYNYARRYKV